MRRLSHSNLDADNFSKAWFPCYLNETHLTTLFSFLMLLFDSDLYELIYFIEGLYLAVPGINHSQTAVMA
jgi:hypothetical protein